MTEFATLSHLRPTPQAQPTFKYVAANHSKSPSASYALQRTAAAVTELRVVKRNMKVFAATFCVAFVSCQTVVTRQAHVVPLIDGQVLLSAVPKFYGDTESFRDSGGGATPKAWAYERFADGSIRITWTIARSARENLVIMDSGVHDMQVPPEAIHTIEGVGIKLPPSRPTELRTGGNTAFLREAITLRPYKHRE